MKTVMDLVKELEIDNRLIDKYFELAIFEKIIYFKEKKRVNFVISSKEIIPHKYLDLLESEMKNKILAFDDIKLSLRISGFKKKTNIFIMKRYWDNIFYEIKKSYPSINGWKDQVEYLFVEDVLKIKLPNEMIYNRVKKDEFDKVIKNMILEELSMEISVEFEKASEKKVDIEKAIKRFELEDEKRIKAMGLHFEKDETEEKYIIHDDEIDENMIYGKNVNVLLEPISRITNEYNTVGVMGDVFFTETRELRNGKIMFDIYITDNTGSICCKLFLTDMTKDEVLNNIKVGSYLKIKGDIITNTYTKQMELTVTGIRREEKKIKIDDAVEKRVELHAHTQMSSMDAITPIKELVKRADLWGHKAIAITDHGVVQGFPDAMNASKGKDIKVIYGVEGYLIDDFKEIIENPNDKDLNQQFIVFDIETTGFSVRTDNITEIGAVKVKNGEIIERYNQLINPERDIPYKVQGLTGITNEMIKDKPTIKTVLPEFLKFIEGSVLVAHNADFDTGFIAKKCMELGLDYNYRKIDTITLAKKLIPEMKRYNLKTLSKKLNISLENHHRAVDDAEATAYIFINFLDMLKKQGIKTIAEINEKLGKVDYKKIRPTHIIILAQNETGLKNLYKLVSDSHINHINKNPMILKSILKKHREGLILGSACSSGELFQAVLRNKTEKEIEEILSLYDYIELNPMENNRYLVENGDVEDEEEIQLINKQLIQYGEKYNKLVVATGDVHFLEEYQSIFRKVLHYYQGFSKENYNPKLYFRTTNEMLEEFEYLGSKKAFEIVVTNTNKIADKIEKIKPIPDETFPPEIEGSEDELRNMCFKKAKSIYGEPLPEIVEKRLERELGSIISNGYAVMYIIAQKLVTKSLSDGYLVGSRGSVGSSFAATMSDITEVNPLPAHYVCTNENCKYSYFYKVGEWGSGIDLPDKNCPKCGRKLKKDGHDIPFEVFLGFEGDKEPDIDLNFSGVYQPVIHKFTEELFGEGYVFRAGTIGTVKDKTAFGYVKKYVDENDLSMSTAEVQRIAQGCTGVKRTSGQHPGGVMVVPHYKDIHDFSPIQYPANDPECGVKTTHFDYHSISGRILKLDILGHDGPTIIRMLEDITGIKITDIPLDDKKTMSIFLSPEALGVSADDINCPVGSLAIPEFGTKFVRQMLVDTKPTTFAELVRISGLSHGTDVWVNNAQDLVRGNVVGLKEVISTRDDIMNYLIFKKLQPKMAFTIMENVRKGRGLKPEFEKAMMDHEVPEWYINSCKKIKYMFPKAHAVAYVMTSFRIAYCKVNYPEAFYATYFTTKVDDFDADLIIKGKDAIRKKLHELLELGNDVTAKESNMITVLEVALEMYARGIKLETVDLYKSHPQEFKVIGKNKLLPPLVALQGVGENAAIKISQESEKKEFISIEDMVKRTKISKTVVQTLKEHGSLKGMSEKNQLSLF